MSMPAASSKFFNIQHITQVNYPQRIYGYIHAAEVQRAARRKGTTRVVQKGGVILISKAREKIEDRGNRDLLAAANPAQRRAVRKEAKGVTIRKKQDRKNWWVLFAKLKAELKSFWKPTQKVVDGVACSAPTRKAF